MMDLNSHIVKNDDNKPFHSSGFAQVATGNRIGSVGGDSFSRRQQIDRERRLVYGYNRSAIGGAYGVLRAKSITGSPARVLGEIKLQQYNSISSKLPKTFSEPPARTFNPFA